MFSPFLHSKDHYTGLSRHGFGLIELMVSISIMVIILGVVLARHDTFNGVVLLRGEAYETALDLREVQQSAVSASGRSTTTNLGTAGAFREVLGVHFDLDDPNQYVLFQDADGDYFYDAGEERGRQGVIDGRFVINELRLGSATPDEVSVIYERPNFDARFFTGPDTTGTGVSANTLEIDIVRVGVSGSGPDVLQTVEVTTAGQISVRQNP
jgi:prepilin-type N-terminal cleavage/methylation domain-containing protein